ncbi:MAG: hypothetical protein NZ518_10190, partial [Dehalococcoidia bacterium]|nr:hypothetical protein [Dehalococcoidia bacterium]
IIVPADNRADIVEIPKKARQDLRFHFVESMDDVLAMTLIDPPTRSAEAASEGEPPYPALVPSVVVDIGAVVSS